MLGPPPCTTRCTATTRVQSRQNALKDRGLLAEARRIQTGKRLLLTQTGNKVTTRACHEDVTASPKRFEKPRFACRGQKNPEWEASFAYPNWQQSDPVRMSRACHGLAKTLWKTEVCLSRPEKSRLGSFFCLQIGSAHV